METLLLFPGRASPLRAAVTVAPHLIEPASSARAKCRGCGERIAAGELRFGESVPNPFADGETTHWFHLECAAFKRPEPFLEALEARTEPLDDAERLVSEAKRGVVHRRLPRIDGAERSPSARAQCRSCRGGIAKEAWRIRLVLYEDGRFLPSGFIHAACCRAYFETADVLGRVKRFSRNLSEDDLKDLQREVEGASLIP
jgi:poly(ADP-ribose) polymerase-like protein